MFTWVRKTLGNVSFYIAAQKSIGADRIRYRCLDEAAIKPGERVLDVGCRPAYYVDRLPAVDYTGFDTSETYIAYARQRYGSRGDFHCETLSAEHLGQLGQFDVILLFGLLHHLDDGQCTTLLDLSARLLTPGGRVVSCGTALHKGQGRISRWMSENDRGEHARQPESYDRMAQASFGDLETRLLDAETRIPASIYMMRMAAPLARTTA